MKQLLLILGLLATVAGYGQKKTYTLADMHVVVDTTTGAFTYEEVVRVDTVTAKQLFDRARLFMVKQFGS